MACVNNSLFIQLLGFFLTFFHKDKLICEECGITIKFNSSKFLNTNNTTNALCQQCIKRYQENEINTKLLKTLKQKLKDKLKRVESKPNLLYHNIDPLISLDKSLLKNFLTEILNTKDSIIIIFNVLYQKIDINNKKEFYIKICDLSNKKELFSEQSLLEILDKFWIKKHIFAKNINF